VGGVSVVMGRIAYSKQRGTKSNNPLFYKQDEGKIANTLFNVDRPHSTINIYTPSSDRMCATMRTLRTTLAGLALLLAALACSANPIQVVEPGQVDPNQTGGGSSNSAGTIISNAPSGETARVVRVVDGDTIEVNLNGETVRIRYLGMNTTERGETCYSQGRDANAALVEGQTVTLVADEENTDRYGRLLRYIYVGNTFVNAELVRQGWAEAVMYEPNDAHWQDLIALEQAAASANRGCHAISDLFDDGTYRR
jgi:endonuclease YncB( thermonuclease family)